MSANRMVEPNYANLTVGEQRAIQALAWPDVWADNLELAVDGHPFDLRGREYERAILRDEHETIIVPKGAQLGLTTVFLAKCAHQVINRRWHVLYLLPVKAGSTKFVQGRIDPIIDSNAKLKAEFSRTDNVAHKQTRTGINWYIRGTNIETELREVPADILVLDERDKANEDLLDDARARLDGSKIARTYELSTPTVDGYGVYDEDGGYPATDQMQWWVPCLHCGSKQVLSFEENIAPWLGEKIEDSLCCCAHCKKPLTDDDRAAVNAGGQWVPAKAGASLRGYHLSQLNSPTKKLIEPKRGILVNWFSGQRDVQKLKAFYTLGLGLPYAAPGDKFTRELLDKCRRSYNLGGIPDGPLYIGVDVGQEILYVTIYTMDRFKNMKLWNLYTITGDGVRKRWQVFDEDVLSRLSNWLCVADAHPDKEEVEALSRKYHGRLAMGFEKDRPEQAVTAAYAKIVYGEPWKVNIDRTMSFDSYIKQFLDGKAILPREARELGELMPRLGYNGFYYQHLQMVRVQQPDTQGRIVARWVTGSGQSGKKPDHWHHSGMFAWTATMHDLPLDVPSDVGQVLAAAGGLIA